MSMLSSSFMDVVVHSVVFYMIFPYFSVLGYIVWLKFYLYYLGWVLSLPYVTEQGKQSFSFFLK